ncbi:migration and invasion-inhibitory protein isoform X2 [Perca fluviatilis]|uniref:migration and invasion-inhibitory protein isoform X2 n=1 Tax=Perca fluviatilis TaxID=8168 RepID=UPI0019648EC9|nr:migration and invasion-inhibitory protein isoform X2 [Perca fluviatilis]
MSSTDRMDILRERNRVLLNQLMQQREKLERLSGCSQSLKREGEDEAEARRDRAEILTLTGGDRGSARAALSKPNVRFADTCERQTGLQGTIPIPFLTSEHRGETAERTPPSGLFKDGNRHALVHSRLQDTGPVSTKSCLVNHSKEQREVRRQVTFQSDECEAISASDRHHLQPLLGYDWIAGVLDAEDSLIERSDEFFNDLHMFRSLNKDKCVHSPQAEFPEENHSVLPLLTDKDGPEANTNTHQCTFSYRINSRLFPVPLHSQECCPVCKEHKSSHPHTTAEPALIRVSIPRSTLLPPYKYKAHRRCSFDPSDSLGLPSHCLSGWSNTGQLTLPPPSSLDLQSILNMKSSSGAHNKELEDLSANKVSSNQISDPISDVSRLAPHNFQHFSSKRKLGSTFYPLH